MGAQYELIPVDFNMFYSAIRVGYRLSKWRRNGYIELKIQKKVWFFFWKTMQKHKVFFTLDKIMLGYLPGGFEAKEGELKWWRLWTCVLTPAAWNRLKQKIMEDYFSKQQDNDDLIAKVTGVGK